MALNMIILQGRLTKDPEPRRTQGGDDMASFCLAVDRYAKAGEEKKADFFNVTAFRKTAEFVCKYFRKGDAMILQGHMQSNRGTDRETGRDVTYWNVLADQVYFGGGKREDDGTAQATPQQAAQVQAWKGQGDARTAPTQARRQERSVDVKMDDWQEDNNGDLPF